MNEPSPPSATYTNSVDSTTAAMSAAWSDIDTAVRCGDTAANLASVAADNMLASNHIEWSGGSST